jgi:hypothetical protein
MNGFPMDGAPVGAGSQTLCLPCLLACFCCDFWLCSCCCSLMVVAPTNLVALNLGQSCKKIWRILTLFPHYLHTIACYHFAYCMAPPSLCDQRIRIISVPPSLSPFLQHWKMTFWHFLAKPRKTQLYVHNCMFIGLIGLPRRQGYCCV